MIKLGPDKGKGARGAEGLAGVQHWDLCVVVRLKDLLLEPAGALVEDGEELPGELLDLVDVRSRVDVGIPRLALWTDNVRRSAAKRKKKPAAQTLPDVAPPVGKIHPFSKLAVTFGPIQRLGCPSRFRISENDQYSLFLTGNTISNRLAVTAP